MTENELRQKVVDIAAGYVGCNEKDGSFKKIIDLYNSHKPLARGYKLQYKDAWCAGFASAVAIEAELTDIIPTEVGCGKYIELFKKLGSWVESDSYKPKAGDYIFYDWQDSGVGDNTGASDHVGIVEKVSGSTITVIEGNMNEAVGRRTLKVNGKYIRGYGVPKYIYNATEAEPVAPVADEIKVGDVVNFTGTKHYTNANAARGKTCKPGKAKVIGVWRTGKHPYQLRYISGGGSTVYGWVDAEDIGDVSGTTIKKGDKVKVKQGAKTYTGRSLAAFVYKNTYTVLELKNDRAVIGINSVVTAAMNVADLTLA